MNSEMTKYLFSSAASNQVPLLIMLHRALGAWVLDYMKRNPTSNTYAGAPTAAATRPTPRPLVRRTDHDQLALEAGIRSSLDSQPT
jgi:hypothetical protein